jgi:hypothetical protein
MPKSTPDLSIVLLQGKHTLEVFDGHRIIFFDPSNASDLCQTGDGHGIMAQCILISGCSMLEIPHLLSDATYHEPRLFICID